MSKAASEPQWYVLQSKPRQEERALEHLRNQLFACYCPYHKVEKIRHGKRVSLSQPLFPGYIFINLCRVTDNWHAIRSTRGVARLVTFANQPLAVPDELIEHLRAQVEQLEDEPLFMEGSPVTITDGPFKDLDAVFCQMDGEERAIILLTVLQRQQQIRIPMEQIRQSG